MAIRTIITEPNKLLRQVSKPVNQVGKEEQKLCLLYTSDAADE